ncbi:MAG: AzlC family ABC transporter permease [Alphaproteobacteria bacterium]
MKSEVSLNQQKNVMIVAFWPLFFQGLRDAALGPVWMLGASMMGFGALMRAKGHEWYEGIFSNLTAFALPGQVILIELYEPTASLIAIWLAVAASSVRLMPMAVVFITAVCPKGVAMWKQLLLGHVIAITAWVYVLNKRDTLTRDQLWPYANGFAWTMFFGVLPFPVFGYFAGDIFPPVVAMAFLMFMPIYFATLFSAEWKHRGRFMAILLGAVLGPPLYTLDPNWGLIVTGLVSGTTAFLIDKRLQS